THGVHRFASGQGGHVTRDQLVAAGLSNRTIDRWVKHQQLVRVYRGVYAVGHLQSNPINAAHGALLAGGDRCALAGGCGLVLWGVWRYWPKRLEIVLAGDRRPTGLIVYRSATLLQRDITTLQGLRVTSAARTMLDNAERLTPKQLARAINELRLRDVLTIDQLADVLARNPTHPAVTLLQPHLEFAQPEPTRSGLEDMFLPLLRKHGLPTPEINVQVVGYRVDAYFPEHCLIVELDGWKHHRTRERFLEDRRQDFAILAATGIPTVRLPYDDVGDATIPQLRTVLERSQAGWAHGVARGPARRPL
ncbi:MAG TPA: type IV toxin-antitoxin system AbiEi family antitoxin domain-containing protein, partial [Solirubrobacteraceae bacterium]|nr:type IV toxin-antitoxin system AbiEi family antitoxin domain-containing protein [Solirubrobacteraceae bacterium]